MIGPSFAKLRCNRALLFLFALVLATVSDAQITIRSLTGVINGHGVGGIAVDAVGNIYMADFGDLVWKITPDGERRVFASGLYGSSGNAIDEQGNLLQADFYGNSITKIDRKGKATPFVTRGLSGPVGIAIRKSGEVYVANCRSNSISRIAPDGTASLFAKSDLFKCPNGIAFDPQENLYAVNFRDNRMLKIDPKGVVTLFTTVSEKGLGHLCYKEGRFYVTATDAHEIFEVALDGTAKRILGNGKRGIVDGSGAKARLSFPNGIALSPYGRRLYVNELVNESLHSFPPRAIIREILLEEKK